MSGCQNAEGANWRAAVGSETGEWVRKDQDGLRGSVRKTFTSGLFAEYIVGLRAEAGDHKRGISDKPMENDNGMTRAQEVGTTML